MTSETSSSPAEPFGFVIAPSTSTEVKIAAWRSNNDTPVVGRIVYFDQVLDDGYTYRTLGTVAGVTTANDMYRDAALLSAATHMGGSAAGMSGSDVKTFDLIPQAVYRRNDSDALWKQAGGSLLISPSTRTDVRLLTQDIVHDMLVGVKDQLVHIGCMRGDTNTPSPMIIPGFAGKRGAFHTAVIGRSGSGKSVASTYMFGAQMLNTSHGMIVVDPQGQWSTEAGFTFSLQKFARQLGREVQVLRVSEDIRLPMRRELLSSFMEEADLWGNLSRMGEDNRRSLSDEVAKQVAAILRDAEGDIPARTVLVKALAAIGTSQTIMGRIYARAGERGDQLRRLLCAMTDEPFINSSGEEEELSPEDLRDGEETLGEVLTSFTPLLNLFERENLQGTPRRALGGDHGFLSGILSVRSSEENAPYVVVDMSSDVRASSRARYAAATGVDTSGEAEMRRLLDNPEIKASIIGVVLDEIKRQAETMYAEGGGNLDTQIIFDEAWRYAPQPNTVDARSSIRALTDQLAGFALDTRKYGIGWTYILQSPSDLNTTIWRQLTYIYTGYGIVGSDKNLLLDQLDDRRQMSLYEQFPSPSSTGVYPFMAIGPVNPLIFTATPAFVNVFTTVEEFLEANASWIDRLCDKNNLPRFTSHPERLAVGSAPATSSARRRGPSSSATSRTNRPAPATQARPSRNPRPISGVQTKRDEGNAVGPPPF